MVGKHFGRLVALRLQRIDPQVERRARRERRRLCRTLVAENAGEMRIEPFRIVAGNPRGSTSEIGRAEPRALVLRQRVGRETRAVGEPRDQLGVEVAFKTQHAEDGRAWRLGAHHKGGGGLAAQRVIDQAGDGGAVAGTGKAVRKAPILERSGRRTTLNLDIPENLDGGGNTRGWRHGRPSMMRTMNMIHMIVSTIALAMKDGPRRTSRLLVRCTPACKTRNATNTHESRTNNRSACRV